MCQRRCQLYGAVRLPTCQLSPEEGPSTNNNLPFAPPVRLLEPETRGRFSKYALQPKSDCAAAGLIVEGYNDQIGTLYISMLGQSSE